jgi:hypothetical protein
MEVAMECEFVLRFKVAEDADTNYLVERLGEAGCDDALVGIGQPGRIALNFTREAESVQLAMSSAVEDVNRAIPGAELVTDSA